jgi:putative Mn2+ efflux pump MntP
MTVIEVIVIGIGLAMDAVSVSVVNGCIIEDLKVGQAIKIAFSFGLFQALMPIIGWAIGEAFLAYIQNVDHWIAFFLLAFIGAKMIWESCSRSRDCTAKNCLHLPTLLLLSLATSLDALAVGLSFSVLRVDIFYAVAIIGGITFSLCLGGIFIAHKVQHASKVKLEIIGGLVLIAIGLKILIEHLIAG